MGLSGRSGFCLDAEPMVKQMEVEVINSSEAPGTAVSTVGDTREAAQEINRLHAKALQSAEDAVDCARAAGKLLLEVKATLSHDKFQRWVRENLRVSVRQAQRYMAVAQGRSMAIGHLAAKSDTMSHLPAPRRSSEGIWRGDRWEPERGCMYLFKDGHGTYWVQPGLDGAIHVCKHYSGTRMSSSGFYWRYTIFAEVHDPDLTSQYYVGTRCPILSRSGIDEVLRSYGLTDLRGSLVFGCETDYPSERPFGEPVPENWYWDGEEPDDGLFQAVKRMGMVNANGAAVLT